MTRKRQVYTAHELWRRELIKHEDWDGWFVVVYDPDDRCKYITVDYDYPGDAMDDAKEWIEQIRSD